MTQQGKALDPSWKQAIVSLKSFIDDNKKYRIEKKSSTKIVAEVFGFGEATVKRVLSEYNKNNGFKDVDLSKRGRPTFSVDASHFEVIRSFIRQGNRDGKHLTLQSVADILKQREPNLRVSLSTISRTLERWGFIFGEGVRTAHLKEKDEVIAKRRRYLRRIRQNRGSSNGLCKPEVYLDETYVNKNHSKDLTWYNEEDGPFVSKPTGKGERLIIINAITCTGWVPGASLVFKSSRKTGDYHGQMNGELFRKWFSEKLIPNIPAESLIVLDNAPYHNILSPNSPPLPNSSKDHISDWLISEGVPISKSSLKAELLEVLKRFEISPIFEVDEIAKSFGHEVIRTPPYHPELQPIELCWGVVKNHVGRNCDFSMENLQQQLQNGFKKVTKTTCQKVISKVKKIEDQYWIEDSEFDPSAESTGGEKIF